MKGHESQISPIPPQRYGDRFVKFIVGVTMSRERAEKKEETSAQSSGRIIEEEEDIPDRSILAVSSPGDAQIDQITLPVIGEAAENSSNVSRSPTQITPQKSYEEFWRNAPLDGFKCTPVTKTSHADIPPPTPPKMDGSVDRRSQEDRRSWQLDGAVGHTLPNGGIPPPTPPKDAYTRRLVNATDDSYVDAGWFGPTTTKIYATQEKELPLPPSMVPAMKEIMVDSTGKEVKEERP